MDLLDELYSKYGPEIDRELEAMVPRDKEPREVYALVWDFMDRGGKRFRPTLCMICARAVGAGGAGNPAAALPAAAAIELFHNFTLIHDDIEDSSQMRRGKPCLHVEHGLPLAINAGDGLFMMVLKATLEIPEGKRARAQEWMVSAFTSVLEGQAIELSWHRNKKFNLSEGDYYKMAGGKTAALVEVAAKCGAYLAGGTEEQIEALGKYGRCIGLAFQIQDDVLNLLGEFKDYQKEIGGDLREGKRTLMTIHALACLPPQDSARLREILSGGSATSEEITWAISAMQKSGSIEYAEKRANGLVSEALETLSALPDSKERDLLREIAKYMVKRKR